MLPVEHKAVIYSNVYSWLIPPPPFSNIFAYLKINRAVVYGCSHVKTLSNVFMFTAINSEM